MARASLLGAVALRWLSAPRLKSCPQGQPHITVLPSRPPTNTRAVRSCRGATTRAPADRHHHDRRHGQIPWRYQERRRRLTPRIPRSMQRIRPSGGPRNRTWRCGFGDRRVTDTPVPLRRRILGAPRPPELSLQTGISARQAPAKRLAERILAPGGAPRTSRDRRDRKRPDQRPWPTRRADDRSLPRRCTEQVRGSARMNAHRGGPSVTSTSHRGGTNGFRQNHDRANDARTPRDSRRSAAATGSRPASHRVARRRTARRIPRPVPPGRRARPAARPLLRPLHRRSRGAVRRLGPRHPPVAARHADKALEARDRAGGGVRRHQRLHRFARGRRLRPSRRRRVRRGAGVAWRGIRRGRRAAAVGVPDPPRLRCHARLAPAPGGRTACRRRPRDARIARHDRRVPRRLRRLPLRQAA